MASVNFKVVIFHNLPILPTFVRLSNLIKIFLLP